VASRIVTAWLDRILAKPIQYLCETPTRLLKNHVAHGMTVLDVGCGAGRHSLAMARFVGPDGRVIAVDIKTEAIDSLRRKAEKAGLSGRIETRVCTEQDLGVGDLGGQIDFALAIYVVHHARDAKSLLKAVHRALRPGGAFLIVEPGHHASAAECKSIETKAREAGLRPAQYPKLRRDWAVALVKD
jgi:ubiquinone/menaquinone biosynthesis C-methylase UbiE